MITDIQYLASGKVAGNIGAEVAKLPATSIRMAIAFIAMLPLFIIYPFLAEVLCGRYHAGRCERIMRKRAEEEIYA